MKPTRRDVLTAGLVSVGASSFLQAAQNGNSDMIECLDYGRSFICNTASFNAVRFWVESRTILYDENADEKLVIYQCGSCKSQNTLAKENLLAEDNYDFMPIYGGEDLLILRRHADVRERDR